MKQYLDLLQNIINNGVEKESGRANMPNTIGISHGVIQMDLQKGFPLLTTKKMYWKGIVHELLWFLRGDTNIKYLVDNNVHIWDQDAYRWYLKNADDRGFEPKYKSIESFIEAIKSYSATKEDIIAGKEGEWDSQYIIGNLGKVYGYQWRNQNGVDQIKEVLDNLKSNPYSRYQIIDTWNKVDFKEMALPPCHLMYQFIVRPLNSYQREDYYAKIHNFNEEQRGEMNPNDSDEHVHILMDEANIPRFYLDLNMYQRSVDTACGAPFNLASMSCLLKIFAKTCNMLEGVATWIGGDTHLYVNHIDDVKEQLKREPYELPQMKINKDLNSLDDILNLSINDFELINYNSHPTIKYELFVGLKK